MRATMPNMDELLWPGTLVAVQLTFREEEAVAVPSNALLPILESGLEGGELVVIEGQVQITDGSRVSARETKAGS